MYENPQGSTAGKGKRMDRPNVLVIDDDDNITSFLQRALAYAGFTVTLANGGQAGLEQALHSSPDVVILDILMPGIDGLEVCRRLRAGGRVPILMLTAKDDVADRVAGLEQGADDYLVKPFALEELIARLRALLRRQFPTIDARLRFADLSVDTGTHEVRRGTRLISLTSKEFELLVAFMRRPRQVLSHEQLLTQVWGFAPGTDTHVLEVYIRYLREKLEAEGEPRLIHTLRGAGYVLKEQP